MVEFINKYILFADSHYILLSAGLSILLFLYGYFLFKGKKVRHIEKDEVLTKSLIVKEYHFYVLFVLLGLGALFFVETFLYGFILAIAVLGGVYMYLFTGMSQSYNWGDTIKIGDVEIVPEDTPDKEVVERVDEETLEFLRAIGKEELAEEDESTLTWQEKWERSKEAGTKKESLGKNLLFGFTGLLAVTALSLGIYFNVISAGKFVQTYSSYAFLGPLIYTIIFWISFTDRLWLVIMDRFLYLLIGIGLSSLFITFPMGVEDFIIVLFFFSLLLIFLSLAERFGFMPPIGYMDIPLIFALCMVFNYYALIFLFCMFTGNFILGLIDRIKNGPELKKVGMYRYSYLSYIALYGIIYWVSTQIILS